EQQRLQRGGPVRSDGPTRREPRPQEPTRRERHPRGADVVRVRLRRRDRGHHRGAHPTGPRLLRRGPLRGLLLHGGPVRRAPARRGHPHGHRDRAARLRPPGARRGDVPLRVRLASSEEVPQAHRGAARRDPVGGVRVLRPHLRHAHRPSGPAGRAGELHQRTVGRPGAGRHGHPDHRLAVGGRTLRRPALAAAGFAGDGRQPHADDAAGRVPGRPVRHRRRHRAGHVAGDRGDDDRGARRRRPEEPQRRPSRGDADHDRLHRPDRRRGEPGRIDLVQHPVRSGHAALRDHAAGQRREHRPRPSLQAGLL
ncbi:MAG: Phosphate transport system permease protein PstC, partial [uncultured Nocardioides sp.]